MSETANPASGVSLCEIFKIGARRSDGTICYGFDRGEPLFVTPQVVSGRARFERQGEVAKKLNKKRAHDHDDWRTPSRRELRILCANWKEVAPEHLQRKKNLVLWSSTEDGYDGGWCQRPGESEPEGLLRDKRFSVPCVRRGA